MEICIPDGHLHRVTYTRCIDTIDSPDDERIVARYMQSIEINIYGKNLYQVGYLQELYRDARSTKLKNNTLLQRKAVQEQWSAIALYRLVNTDVTDIVQGQQFIGRFLTH